MEACHPPAPEIPRHAGARGRGAVWRWMGLRWSASDRRLGGRPKPGFDWLLALACGMALLLFTPWRAAYQLGPAEGYELMKAVLVSQGHALYGPFWNDQPPLHTELLAGLFLLFGPSVRLGRLVSIGSAMLLFAGLSALARRGSTRLAGVMAVGLLLCASESLRLSVAAMLEVPAFALGVAALWLWVQGRERGTVGWFAASGAVFGGALQVKFTAALLGPAMAVDFLVERWRQRCRAGNPPHAGASETAGTRPQQDPGWQGALAWLAGATGVFGLVAWIWYQPGTWTVFWKSHFSAGTAAGATELGEVFRWSLFQDDLGLVLPGLAGLVLLAGARRREVLMPAVILFTTLLAHGLHRPVWPTYRLHFAIPLAWLGGLGLVEGFRTWRRRRQAADSGHWAATTASVTIWSVGLSAALTLAPEKAWREWRQLRRADPAASEKTVVMLRAAAARNVRWVVTDQTLAAFWAGLPIPPELVILPAKRFWSGQITLQEVREVVVCYQPELVYLASWPEAFEEIADLLQAHYMPDSQGSCLFKRKRPEGSP
ncbi:MAG: hypothetical protein D6766_05835 [Verrucomicrobia bacterium]|nr:MAG: hypothetical protein D6766_05835 [Verrucomicrobiota bacterium]